MEPDRTLTDTDRLIPAVLIVGLMSFVASLSFRAVFDSWVFVVAPLLGVVGAAIIGAVAMRKRLLLGESIGLSLVGYLAVGLVAVGGIPVPSSLLSLVHGVTGGWIRILDTLPPADAASDLKALPFTAAWLGTTIGIELLHRSKRIGSAAIGPLIALAVSVLFSTEQRRLVVFQGVLLIVLFLLLVAVQQEVRRSAEVSTRLKPKRVVLGTLMLIGVVVASPVAASVIVPDAPAGRVELRELRSTPWDPFSVPSPLTEFKALLLEDRSDGPLFSVVGPAIDRISLVAMEYYDGRVWQVADVSPGAEAEFKPAGPTFAPQTESGRHMTHTIRIENLDMPWLPLTGEPVRITAGDGGDLGLQRNFVSGSIAQPGGLSPGSTYTIDALVQEELDDDSIDASRILYDANRFAVDLLDPAIENTAADIVEGVDVGWRQIRAIGEYLRSSGFYYVQGVPPGHSMVRLRGFLRPENIAGPVGYGEQYAAAAALLGRAINLPTRAVMGFSIPSDRWSGSSASVFGEDVTGWMEVLTEEYGWVPIDVTPDPTRVPREKTRKPTSKTVATPNPPPPPPTTTTSTTIPLGGEEEEIEDQVVEEDPPLEQPEPDETPSILLRAGVVGVAIPVIGLLVFSLLVMLAKVSMRSRRRRGDPAGKIAGAWYETLDRYREAGFGVDPRSTPTELAVAFAGDRSSGGALDELAIQVDRAAFHPEPPSPDRADVAWAIADMAISHSREGRSVRDRVKMAIDPRTILRPSRREDPSGSTRRRRKEKHRDRRS